MSNNVNLKKLSISWFGGEPLLYPNIIRNISRNIISFCNNKDISYSASIISNGRFLTQDNVALLLDCKVKKIQLSIDGMKDYFVQQKQASNLDFESTIENIIDAAQHLLITIRINVVNNICEAIKLTDYLLGEKKLDNKIRVYIAQVQDYDLGLCTQELQEKHSIFLEQEAVYQEYVLSKYSKESLVIKVPQRKKVSCFAGCTANMCIGPKGEFYQCEHRFGDTASEIGSVRKGLYYYQNKLKYTNLEHEEKCLKCNILPLCLGGCIDDRVHGRNIINCDRYKEQLINSIILSKIR